MTKQIRRYPYTEIVRVVDGDTVVVNLDLGLRIYAHKIVIRLNGLNCPELVTEQGKLAAKATTEFLQAQPVWDLVTYGPDKYGRWLGDFFTANEESLTDFLLEENLASVVEKKK